MLNGILFGLKKFFSEIGSGDMVILFSSLILSVTAISGVGFLSDRFQRSIQEQASIVLGAEMVLGQAHRSMIVISRLQSSWI